MADVAVIGGGWSGFAAAVTLADAGVAVDVFEASDTLGGRARRVAIDSMTVDNGQHLLLGAYRDTLALIERVHRDVSRVDSLYLRTPLQLSGPGRFALRARNLPSPFHMVTALLFAADCSVVERIAMVRAFSRFKSNGWTAPPGATVARLLARQPVALIERIWSPLCLAALNTPIEEASAQVYLNVLRDSLASSRAASDMVIPLVDLSTLFPEAAARVVEAAGGKVRRGTRVRSIQRRFASNELVPDSSEPARGSSEPARGAIAIDTGAAVHHVQAAIIATAPWQALGLLEGHAEARTAIAQIRGYRYEPICTIYMRFDDPITLPFPMLQLGTGPGQWLFAPNPDADIAQIVAVVISAQGPYRTLGRDVLVQRVCAQLERNVRGWKAQAPIATQVIVERRATHAATPGRAHPLAGRVADGLYLAGDHTDPDYPATLEAACRSGIRAAQALLADRIVP